MPPNSKRRSLRSAFAGLFSSSKNRPRDEEPINLKISTVEASPSNLHASVLLREPEESMAGAATTGMDNAPGEGPRSHSDVVPSTAEIAHRQSLPLQHTQSMSIFPNTQNVKLRNVTFNSSQNVYNSQGSRKEGWELLMENVASNALHDSNARFDPPKCDEDTRVEVTKELMDWIEDREAPKQLLCMTGAAGAGKSALQQTIAEKCSDSNILGSAFFFSAQDPTRNNLSHIVPTIACQLGLHNSHLRDAIAKVVEDDPLVFKRQIKTQMNTLIVTPFKRVCTSGDLDPNTFPHAIFIDGLDECSGEANQAELLSTIKHCLLENDLPFRIFVASRPEWAIRSALRMEPEGYLYQLTYHIKLSDMYDATGDIRRYLWSRLRAIGSRSHDSRAYSHLWPTKEDVERLVAAASGQFVYAATVVKYISEHRSSPVDRLRTIIEWTPRDGQQTRPFEALDTLYRSILSVAKELYEAVDTNQGRDFVTLIRAHQFNSGGRTGIRSSLSAFDEIIGLEEGGHQVLFSDLHSLVFFRQSPIGGENWEEMRFYHHSFSEFLDSESRAQHLFVSEAQVRRYVTESCLQRIPQREDLRNSDNRMGLVRDLACYYNPRATHVDDFRLVDFTRSNGWRRFDEEFSSPDLCQPTNFDKWQNLAHFAFDAIRRLDDELHEPELAAIVKVYFDKWKKNYQHYGFEIPQGDQDEEEEDDDARRRGWRGWRAFKFLC